MVPFQSLLLLSILQFLPYAIYGHTHYLFQWIKPKKKFLQDLETVRSMILQDLACKITTDFGTISGEIMPDQS